MWMRSPKALYVIFKTGLVSEHSGISIKSHTQFTLPTLFTLQFQLTCSLFLLNISFCSLLFLIPSTVAESDHFLNLFQSLARILHHNEAFIVNLTVSDDFYPYTLILLNFLC